MKEIFAQLRPGRPDKIGEVECLNAHGTRQGLPPVRFFFDANSGLAGENGAIHGESAGPDARPN